MYRLPWLLSSEESACNTGNTGLLPRSRRSPGEGNGNPLQVLLPGKSHGKSLASYSPWITRVRHDLVTKPPNQELCSGISLWL